MYPRVKIAAKEIDEQLKFALQIRDDITRLSQTVLDLRKIKTQLANRNELLKDDAKAKELVKNSRALINKLDVLEAKLHNPRAKVNYDILADKGGARLYSQQALLYEIVKNNDGPITQGMRDVYAEQSKELGRLIGELAGLLTVDLARLNDEARALGVPHILSRSTGGKER